MDDTELQRRMVPSLATGISGWDAAHPQATLVEMKAALDAAWAAARAELLTGWANAQPEADLAGQSAARRPTCPACGVLLVADGRRRCALVLDGDQALKLERAHARYPRCGQGLSPLDERLGLGRSHLSSSLIERAVLLGSLLPFRHAQQVLTRFTQVVVRAETLRTWTLRLGDAAEALDGALLAEIDQGLHDLPRRAGAAAPERRWGHGRVTRRNLG